MIISDPDEDPTIISDDPARRTEDLQRNSSAVQKRLDRWCRPRRKTPPGPAAGSSRPQTQSPRRRGGPRVGPCMRTWLENRKWLSQPWTAHNRAIRAAAAERTNERQTTLRPRKRARARLGGWPSSWGENVFNMYHQHTTGVT